jgi:hypothetical protein
MVIRYWQRALVSPEAQDEDVPVAALVSKLHLGKTNCTAAATATAAAAAPVQARVFVTGKQGERQLSAC